MTLRKLLGLLDRRALTQPRKPVLDKRVIIVLDSYNTNSQYIYNTSKQSEMCGLHLLPLGQRSPDKRRPHVPRDIGKSELAPNKPGAVCAVALGLLLREVALDDARDAVDLLDVAFDGAGDLFLVILVEPLYARDKQSLVISHKLI